MKLLNKNSIIFTIITFLLVAYSISTTSKSNTNIKTDKSEIKATTESSTENQLMNNSKASAKFGEIENEEEEENDHEVFNRKDFFGNDIMGLSDIFDNYPKGKGVKSHSSISSKSYSYSNINGKESKKMSGLNLEEDEDNGKTRKYGKIYKKKNNDPTWQKEQASSSDEQENQIVKEPIEKNLNKDEEDEQFGSDPFFNSLFRNKKKGKRGLKALKDSSSEENLPSIPDPWETHMSIMKQQKALFKKQQKLLDAQNSMFQNFFDRKAGDLKKKYFKR